jgi:hypothetical protein
LAHTSFSVALPRRELDLRDRVAHGLDLERLLDHPRVLEDGGRLAQRDAPRPQRVGEAEVDELDGERHGVRTLGAAQDVDDLVGEAERVGRVVRRLLGRDPGRGADLGDGGQAGGEVLPQVELEEDRRSAEDVEEEARGAHEAPDRHVARAGGVEDVDRVGGEHGADAHRAHRRVEARLSLEIERVEAGGVGRRHPVSLPAGGERWAAERRACSGAAGADPSPGGRMCRLGRAAPRGPRALGRPAPRDPGAPLGGQAPRVWAGAPIVSSQDASADVAQGDGGTADRCRRHDAADDR